MSDIKKITLMLLSLPPWIFFFVRNGTPGVNLRGYFNNIQCPGFHNIACNRGLFF